MSPIFKFSVLFNSILLNGILCRIMNLLPLDQERTLFLSHRVVTESEEFDGGVLVDDKGIIEAVLTKDSVQAFLSQHDGNFQIIDGGNLALMAGVIDSHVHVNEPGRTSWEGFVTATKAAAFGGITTIVDMPLYSIPPTTTLENLLVKATYAKEEIYVDVAFWGGVVPGNEDDLKDLLDAGVVGFICYLIDSGMSKFPHISADELPEVFKVLNGTGIVFAFHAELQVGNTTAIPNSDPLLYDTYLATHPAEYETAAVSLITSLINQTDVHVHIVHVSAEGVVPILEKARDRRIKAGYEGWRGGITAETCNHYLILSAEQVPPKRTEFKCSPPIRSESNRQKLWQYIANRRLDLITSDHSPSSAKGPNFLKARGGISSLQFDLPLFWTETKARGYSLSTVSHYLSAGPARLLGLQERKGSIMVGLDADIIFFDPDASFVVTPEVIQYKNKISPYMHRVLNGIVKQTYIRGQLIYSDGELYGQPKGQLILSDEFWSNFE